MRNTIILFLATLLLANAQPPAEQTSMRDGPPHPPPHQKARAQRGQQGLELKDLDRLSKQLELSPEQESQLRELLFESGKAKLTRQGKVKVLEFTLQAMLMEEQPNLRELREIHEEMSRERAALGWERLETQLKLKGILTPEQQRKLRTRPRRGPRGRQPGDRRLSGPPGPPAPPQP